jgi:hypothetical protein
LFWSCYNKEGNGRVTITFFAIASLFFCSVEGNDNNVAIAFCFGLAAVEKATTAFDAITFCFGLITTKKIYFALVKKAMLPLPSSILVSLQQKR